MIARQVQTGAASSGRLAVHGPARLMSDVVTGAARNAADELVEYARRRPRGDAAAAAALLDAARVAMAWSETYVATQAVESYTFDPDFDYGAQW
jgi:hypothetical protein